MILIPLFVPGMIDYILLWRFPKGIYQEMKDNPEGYLEVYKEKGVYRDLEKLRDLDKSKSHRRGFFLSLTWIFGIMIFVALIISFDIELGRGFWLFGSSLWYYGGYIALIIILYLKIL